MEQGEPFLFYKIIKKVENIKKNNLFVVVKKKKIS
jgi:hypothetical protein